MFSFVNDVFVKANFNRVRYWWLIPPVSVLILFSIYFFIDISTFEQRYINLNKDLFLTMNNGISLFKDFWYNITQLGDVVIVFPLLFIFLFYAPKIWEALITSSLMSLIVSFGLKEFFSVSRPAAVLSTKRFTIMGEWLTSKTSLPSGHSITASIIITTLLVAFMPSKFYGRLIWSLLFIFFGVIIVLSRVGVGAHYPVDVLTGSLIGFVLAVFGIKLNTKTRWLSWAENPKFHPIFMLIFISWGIALADRMTEISLPVYYISLFSLITTLYLITIQYVKYKIKQIGTNN